MRRRVTLTEFQLPIFPEIKDQSFLGNATLFNQKDNGDNKFHNHKTNSEFVYLAWPNQQDAHALVAENLEYRSLILCTYSPG